MESLEWQDCTKFRLNPECVRIITRVRHRKYTVGIGLKQKIQINGQISVLSLSMYCLSRIAPTLAMDYSLNNRPGRVWSDQDRPAGARHFKQRQGLHMTRRRKIYEGKAKILYEGPEPGTLIQYFKDDATAFNAQKKGTISGKGVINNRVSEHVFTRLSYIGIPTHFIRRLNMREQLIRQVEIVPIEVIVRNVAAGSLSKRLGIEEGTPLPHTLLEYCYKDDSLGDPLVAEEHIACFGWATQEEMQDISSMAIRINDFMCGMFAAIGIRLVDFKLEFGRLFDGDFSRIILADEISPDGCRLWDIETGEKLDKDRFRRDLGGEAEAYQEVARRLGLMPDESEGAVLDMVSHRLRKGK
jgi:phosphoribosylaminoimidazole-succinocarboxamide synthase